MANKVLLIGVKILKSQSVIENNVNDKELSKVIMNVQEIQLKPILGKTLYEQVCNEAMSKIEDSGYSMPELYSTLLEDYIKPYLIYATIAEFLVINNYKITNKGVQKLNDNSSTSINSQEVEYLKNYYDNFVSTYKGNLIKFLKEQNILENSADVNVTYPAIGWHLDEGLCSVRTPSSSSQLPSSNETDPIWTDEKGNYYTKEQIDALLIGHTSPVISVNSKTGVVVLNKTDIGLSNVDNTSDLNKPISTATQSALNMKADLVEGKVPASQLPAYVDDVLEFASASNFPVTGESGKIYITADTNLTYRWTGTGYGVISQSLALGETSSTAYRGDRGKMAFDHITVTGNPHSTSLYDVALIGNDTDRDLIINGVYLGTGSINATTVVLGQRLENIKSIDSVLIGYDAGLMSDYNGRNVLVGYKAGTSNSAGNYNTGMGYAALQLSTGSQLTGLGYESLQNSTGSYNSGLGYRTLKALTTGQFNVAVGTNAMASQVTASNNVAIGYGALWAGGAYGTAAQNSVAIGYSALRFNGDSSNNTAIGYQAGETKNEGYNVFIGYQAGKNHEGSDCLFISNSERPDPLIFGEFDAQTLTINGSLKVTDLGGTGTRMVVALNDGLLTTQAIPSVTWIDFSELSTITGFAGYVNKTIRYAVNGKVLYVTWNIQSTSGSGSGLTTSFTLPFNVSSIGAYQYGVSHIQNATNQNQAAYRIEAGTNLLEFSNNASFSNFNAWTDSQTRGVHGFGIFSLD